jgi:putative RNA 2'-phosphotransferase
MDPVRISKTMAFLLRHRPDVGNLEPDAEGWVGLSALCEAVSRLVHEPVDLALIRTVVVQAQIARFEIVEERIRAAAAPRRSNPDVQRHPRCQPPDILYHATTAPLLEQVRRDGVLAAGKDKFVYLSADEAHAWRVAHRLEGGPARVLVVDAARARRHGVRFFRNKRNGLYLSTPVPLHDVLNLLPGYAEQHSAGGFPMRRDPDGRARIALIQVARRSGTTWEVAKGKLEPGETPEATAIREVQEEMGLTAELRVTRYLDTVRYGFLAPGGLPRLKSVYLYLMEAPVPIQGFQPREAEGVSDVDWFTGDEAVRAVTHSSLVPVMHQLKQVLDDIERVPEAEAV